MTDTTDTTIWKPGLSDKREKRGGKGEYNETLLVSREVNEAYGNQTI